MTAEATAAAGFAIGAAGVTVATPVVIRLAARMDFFDVPREYRQHVAPTPLLGGTAVLAAFLVAALALGHLSTGLGVAVGLAGVMWAIGTIDDRVAVAPHWRLIATAAAAVALYAFGIGWATDAGGVVNLSLTVVWITGLVTAFNLTDNLDGACGSVTAVSAAAIGVLAALRGQTAVAGLAFALSGACAGFLVWNLATPSKVFLGDGGSMLAGFLIATLAMLTSRHASAGNAGVLVGAMLAGLPILDVTLVSLSRTRRGVPLVTGGRDHLTHRILGKLGSARGVALALALSQAGLGGLAIGGYELGTGAVAGFALAAFVAGVGAILVLDSPQWRPASIAVTAPESPGVEEVVPVTLDAG